MSKYHAFADRLDALFQEGRTRYLGLYAILTDAREAVNAAKTPVEAYKAKIAFNQAEKDWAAQGGEHAALAFEQESNRLVEELRRFISADNERFIWRDHDGEASEEIRHTTDPGVLGQMIERFRENQTMLRCIAHHIDHAVGCICAADLPEDRRNALRKLRQSFKPEDEGKGLAFSRLVQAYQEAAGCELSVNALRAGKAAWELDTATRKAAAEF